MERRCNIIPLKKKGSDDNCRNYRGIMLLNSVYKILSTLIYRRLKEYTKKTVGSYQCGFTEGKSTVDAIHAVKQTMEKTNEHNIELHLLFIDFQQALDKVKRGKLYRAMERMKIPSKLIGLIRMTMKNTTACVRVEEGQTERFGINSGVRQGDALSATLFNIALEETIKDLDIKGSLTTKEGQIIAYADDIVILARTRKKMEDTFKKMRTAAKNMGLLINENKTKYIRCNKDAIHQQHAIKIDDLSFEEVNNFNYLGININRNCERDEELRKRLLLRVP